MYSRKCLLLGFFVQIQADISGREGKAHLWHTMKHYSMQRPSSIPKSNTEESLTAWADHTIDVATLFLVLESNSWCFILQSTCAPYGWAWMQPAGLALHGRLAKVTRQQTADVYTATYLHGMMLTLLNRKASYWGSSNKSINHFPFHKASCAEQYIQQTNISAVFLL